MRPGLRIPYQRQFTFQGGIFARSRRYATRVKRRSPLKPMNQALAPTEIRRTSKSDLEIVWSDGASLKYTAAVLRDACPCATCREKRGAEPEPELLPVLSAAETQPMTVAGMKPVGSYAYSIDFSDGHDSGIFTLEYLRELGVPT